MTSLNRETFATVMAARGLTLSALSRRVELAEADLREQIEREDGPPVALLNALSRELAVPVFVFFASKGPSLGASLIDFRSGAESIVQLSAQGTKVIDVARRVQHLARRAKLERIELPAVGLEELETERFAKEMRDWIGIGIADQLAAAGDMAFYRHCRYLVEKKSIFVLNRSYPSEDGSGISISDHFAPIIVINTRNQLPARRTFTLLHEFAHLLCGRSGVSNPFMISSRFEEACNRFAANFLLPVDAVRQEFRRRQLGVDVSPAVIADFAAVFRASQQATILRLERLGLVRRGAYRRWLNEVSTRNPDYGLDQRRGGARVPEAQRKLATFGFNFARVFSGALRESLITDIELARGTGLKAKYQQPFFEFAATARASDAEE